MTKEALQIALNALTDFDYDKRIKAIEIIKEALETKDEPVAWMNDSTPSGIFARHIEGAKNFGCTIPLYTTLQRTWVGLTDEEIQECLQGLPTQTIDVYARRIEIKIKEKNNG